MPVEMLERLITLLEKEKTETLSFNEKLEVKEIKTLIHQYKTVYYI